MLTTTVSTTEGRQVFIRDFASKHKWQHPKSTEPEPPLHCLAKNKCCFLWLVQRSDCKEDPHTCNSLKCSIYSFILWENLLIETVSPVWLPELKKLNLYVNSKKTALYRCLNECMEPELHACISNCRTLFACKSGFVLKKSRWYCSGSYYRSVIWLVWQLYCVCLFAIAVICCFLMAREFDGMSGDGAYIFELSYLVLYGSFTWYCRSDDCTLAIKPHLPKYMWHNFSAGLRKQNCSQGPNVTFSVKVKS